MNEDEETMSEEDIDMNLEYNDKAKRKEIVSSYMISEPLSTDNRPLKRRSPRRASTERQNAYNLTHGGPKIYQQDEILLSMGLDIAFLL